MQVCIHRNVYERVKVGSAYYMILNYGDLIHFCMSHALGYLSSMSHVLVGSCARTWTVCKEVLLIQSKFSLNLKVKFKTMKCFYEMISPFMIACVCIS